MTGQHTHKIVGMDPHRHLRNPVLKSSIGTKRHSLHNYNKKHGANVY